MRNIIRLFISLATVFLITAYSNIRQDSTKELETIRPALLSKIKQLVNDGAVILGSAPKRSYSLQNQPAADLEVQKIATELLGNVDGVNLKSKKFGKGVVVGGMDMKEVFALINCVPDCQLPEDSTTHYGHRTLDSSEIYFITNQIGETKHITPEFRIRGLQPELWLATTGSIRQLPAYKQKDKETSVPLKLAPYESIFVVFRKQAGQALAKDTDTNYPNQTLFADLTDSLTVDFQASQRGSEKPILLGKLNDWTTVPDNRIKYNSGKAFYTCKFTIDQIPEGEQMLIDLGSFTAIPKVSVNSTDAGGMWTAPYQLDISKLVKVEENEPQVEVVNTWINRLTGDLNIPENQRQTWCSVNTYTVESHLQPSGFFDPVQILGVQY